MYGALPCETSSLPLHFPPLYPALSVSHHVQIPISRNRPPKPFDNVPEWFTSNLDSFNGPFLLFGEVVPTLITQDPKVGITIIMGALNRHFKLLMMASASGLELGLLGAQFETELQSLAAYLSYCARTLDTSQAELLISTILDQSRILLARADPNSTDETLLLRVCFGLRSCFIQVASSALLHHRKSTSLQASFQQISAEALMLASKSATILCSMAVNPKPSPVHFRLLLLLMQHLFQLHAKVDDEDSRGRSGWAVLTHESVKALPNELRWSLAFLVSALNTSALISSGTPTYYSSWDSIQDLLQSDLLKAPKDGKNSPTKLPTGPSRGILDLLTRFQYFCSIWSTPPMDVQALLARFFSERMSETSNRSLQFFDTDEQLSSSPSSFDRYLFIVKKFVLSSAQMTPFKIRMGVAKLIETFLNVLEDLESTKLDPEMDLAPLLRNCLQLSLTLVVFLNDQEVQNFLLERLLAIPFQTLPPLAIKIVTQGLFRFLAKISPKELQQSPAAPELQTQSEFDFLDFGLGSSDQNSISTNTHIRSVDSELKNFEQSRKRLAEHLSSALLEHIIAYYLKISSSTHSSTLPSTSTAQQSFIANLTSGQSKRPKTLDISNAATPLLNAEKLVTTYMKQARVIYEGSFSSASTLLIAPARLADFLCNVTVSPLVRHSINESIQALIIASRNTTLEADLMPKWQSLWQTSVRGVSLPQMPSKLLAQLAELQGLLLYALRSDKHYDCLEYAANNGFYRRKDAMGRSIPLFAAKSWLDLVSTLLKLNVYISTPMPPDCGIWLSSVLINASLEHAPQPAVMEIISRLNQIVSLPASTSIPVSLHVLSTIAAEKSFVGDAIASLSPGHIAKAIILGFFNFRQRQPDRAQELTPYFTKLVKHIDDVIERNRRELAENGTKYGRFDDSIYEFVSSVFKSVPHWLHSRSDARYNVFGRLLTELFLEPLKAMAPISVPLTADADQFFRGSAISQNPTPAQGSSSMGMVFGKSPKPVPKKASTTSSSSSGGSGAGARPVPTKLVAPTLINDNAVRFLPFAIHAIAQLPFETDGDLQRYTSDLVVSIFRSFVTGKDSSHDARLIEQLAAGLVENSTATISMASAAFGKGSALGIKDDPNAPLSSNDLQLAAAVGSRIRSFRHFFCANLIPWLKLLIEQRANGNADIAPSDDATDTNCFVMARILSWLFLKLKHSKEQPALELVKSYLMTSHYMLDLYRAIKPTVGALAKKEMLNYFIIFCSTFLKLVPHSNPLEWLQSNESILYEQLMVTLREWLAAVVRDVDYISTASWPPAAPEADMKSDLRQDHVNAGFMRARDSATPLSLLALVDHRGTVEALKELARALCEAIEFVRQLGAIHLVKQIQERMQSILYLPDEKALAQRHARGDIKAALEVARKDFGKINVLINYVQ